MIGYIDEDDDEDEGDGSENADGGKLPSPAREVSEKKNFTIAEQSAVFLGTRGSIRPVLSGDALVISDERQKPDKFRKAFRFNPCLLPNEVPWTDPRHPKPSLGASFCF